LDAE
jgi:hypothetical protein